MRPALALIFASLLPVAAGAQQVSVEKLGCKKGVHLVASGAKLSAVLSELSKALTFELHFEGGEDRAVNIDATKRAPELVARLMESDSVITDDAPDPKCPGQMRLTRVWVLPRGEDAPAPHDMTPMEMYRKAHGLPPEDPPPADNDPDR